MYSKSVQYILSLFFSIWRDALRRSVAITAQGHREPDTKSSPRPRRMEKFCHTTRYTLHDGYILIYIVILVITGIFDIINVIYNVYYVSSVNRYNKRTGVLHILKEEYFLFMWSCSLIQLLFHKPAGLLACIIYIIQYTCIHSYILTHPLPPSTLSPPHRLLRQRVGEVVSGMCPHGGATHPPRAIRLVPSTPGHGGSSRHGRQEVWPGRYSPGPPGYRPWGLQPRASQPCGDDPGAGRVLYRRAEPGVRSALLCRNEPWRSHVIDLWVMASSIVTSFVLTYNVWVPHLPRRHIQRSFVTCRNVWMTLCVMSLTSCLADLMDNDVTSAWPYVKWHHVWLTSWTMTSRLHGPIWNGTMFGWPHGQLRHVWMTSSIVTLLSG